MSDSLRRLQRFPHYTTPTTCCRGLLPEQVPPYATRRGAWLGTDLSTLIVAHEPSARSQQMVLRRQATREQGNEKAEVPSWSLVPLVPGSLPFEKCLHCGIHLCGFAARREVAAVGFENQRLRVDQGSEIERGLGIHHVVLGGGDHQHLCLHLLCRGF